MSKLLDAPKKAFAQFQKLPMIQQIVIVVAVALIGYWLWKNYLAKLVKSREGFQRAASHGGASGAVVCTLYYTEWCPHCKTVKPDWAKLQQDLHGKSINGKHIVVEMVDCDKDKAKAEAAGVQGFPTIKFTVNGQSMDYSGERNYAAFKSHIESL